MKIETIFITQIASIFTFILTVFGLYHLLVRQKDSVIEVLKERTAFLESKMREMEKQTPDALVESLSRRVELTKAEISRLLQEGEEYKGQITDKEDELRSIKLKLDKLSSLVEDSDLVCPECGAPLLRREYYTIYGPGDQDAGVEYVEYECGYVVDEGGRHGDRCCGNREAST